MLLASPVVVNFGFAQGSTVMFVNPPSVQTNPTETFYVDVYVTDAVDVAGFEFKVTWDLALTEFPPTVYEGNFLSDWFPGQTLMTVAPNFLFKYVLVTGFLTAPGSVSGEGALATLAFTVKGTESGSSTIHIYDTKLWNQDGTLLAHTTGDGYFYTTKPKPVFSWTPSAPIAGQVVTFDGSASFDPAYSGSIVSWEWDFGDGSPHEFGAIVEHTYANYQPTPYKVTLTVTDADEPAESWSVTKDLLIWRDLAVIGLWPSMDEWDNTHFDGYQTQMDPYEGLPGLVWVLVTVGNKGTQTETYTVTVYADRDTTVIGDEVELFPGMRTRKLAAGAGTGWSLWYVWDISYGASSYGVNDPVPANTQWTITAVISSAFDQDPSNNMMQVPFGVHGNVEVTRIVRASAGQRDHVYKMKHGPITFGGFIENFDNIYSVMREPTDQGEWGRIAFDIFDESGSLVTHLTTDAVYLNYLEENADQLTATWSDLAVGKYNAVAYAEFGTDGASFPYWGENTVSFSFAIIP